VCDLETSTMSELGSSGGAKPQKKLKIDGEHAHQEIYTGEKGRQGEYIPSI
jgi:hypothetical protein